MTGVLTLQGVTRRFGARVAVDDVSLTVDAGELFALLGPSGSGKTTLLRLVAGFETPDAGAITLGDRCVAGPGAWVEPEHRGIGLVPQGDTLFPHLSVADNVRFGVPDDRAAADRALEMVGLADRAASHPGELSGGERQRVALARALAPGPSTILLDEPFSALDQALRGTLRREVVSVLRDAGATAVLVTHDQEEALGLCDRVGVVRDGRLVQVGDPIELYWRPVDAWVAQFLGEVNVLPADVHSGIAQTPLGQLPACAITRARLAGHSIGLAVGVRPEQLLLDPDEGGDAVVIGREFRGHDVLYEIRHEAAGTLLVQLPSLELFEIGSRVRVRPNERSTAAVFRHDH
jgi:iron(III) transport system ATP-binding protein